VRAIRHDGVAEGKVLSVVSEHRLRRLRRELDYLHVMRTTIHYSQPYGTAELSLTV
jgi:hypothetical protein